MIGWYFSWIYRCLLFIQVVDRKNQAIPHAILNKKHSYLNGFQFLGVPKSTLKVEFIKKKHVNKLVQWTPGVKK